MRKPLLVVLAVLVVAGAIGLGLAQRSAGPAVRTTEEVITVPGGVTSPGSVSIDTTLYVPASATAANPAPAVVVSPGFGSDKTGVDSDARDLAAHGYVALTWSLRGFGKSTGKIALDAPDAEIADLKLLIDRLGRRTDVLQDGPGDPRVGLVGASYGGGVSLLGAALDQRVDATVPVITWNSLESAFLPGEVFKAQYAAVFFSGGPGGVCSRFAQRVCEAYTRLAQAGAATPADRALLAASSPAGVAAQIKAPTLLIQGQNDTLFPLSESLATARQLQAAGTPVHLAWLNGGHDKPFGKTGDATIRSLTTTWLDRWLRRDAAVDTGAVLRWDRSSGGTGTADQLPPLRQATAVALVGAPTQPLVNPPGGRPASVSSVPGAGALGALAGGLGLDVPGQSAVWQSEVLTSSSEMLGAGTLTATVTSSTGSAVLFAKVLDVGPDGAAVLPGGQVTPALVLPGKVTFALPALAHVFPAGHRIRIALASTDLAYAGPGAPAAYSVTIDPAGALTLPLGPVTGGGGYTGLAVTSAAILLALTALAALVVVRRRRGRKRDLGTDDVPPVVIRGLVKSYADGFRAVDGVNLTVERGQVLGLLGPNGAGKTTLLRMLTGLIRPDEGELLLFGRPVRSGAPVLSRVGVFIEGPGLLPHLSGLDNLRLYWTSTAPSMDGSYIEEALEVAGLGDAVHRPLRTYSQGMRQRLAIAQAMLGRPDLLILDEPTNGLDPPQIKEVREVIQRIAATGRTVLVSSHLLAEVEQMCSHVTVMSRGKVVAGGTVEQMLADDGTVRVEVAPDDLTRAEVVLAGLTGIAGVQVDDGALAVNLDGASRAEVVAVLVQADVAVLGVASRRRLEDVFLELLGGRP